MFIMFGNDPPGVISRFSEMQKIHILRRDGAEIRQKLEIDHGSPEFLAEQDERNGLHALRLDQGQRFEKFIERAKPPGKITTAFARIRKCILRMAK